MNLSWLEDFVALATAGGFSRAAETRHMTQPAFSRRIRALEAWLGVTLVDRATQPIALTEVGTWYVGVAREALARMARMPDEARAIADTRAATIRIAATHALSLTFLPTWLRTFEAHLLAAPVELVSDVLERCEDAMLEGACSSCSVTRTATRADDSMRVARRRSSDATCYSPSARRCRAARARVIASTARRRRRSSPIARRRAWAASSRR